MLVSEVLGSHLGFLLRMGSFFHILNSEYPAPSARGRNLLIAAMFGVFIGFFLLFFEPFDINPAKGVYTFETLCFFGVITASVLAFFMYCLPLLFAEFFQDSRWKVKHQIIFLAVILFVIATLNGLYTNHITSLTFSWANYWWIIERTFVLGTIPFSFLVLVDYQRRKYANGLEASYLQHKNIRTEQDSKSTTWSIYTDLKHERIAFKDDVFCYAVAVGNYIDLHSAQDGKVERQTYRVSLSSFEKQLDATHLKRCHRSYLVNLRKVVNVSGNAQGLKLTLIDDVAVVPVSRKYIPAVKQFFEEFGQPES